MGKTITVADMYTITQSLPPSLFLRDGKDIWFVGVASLALNVRNGMTALVTKAFRGETLEIMSHEEVNEILAKEEKEADEKAGLNE